jgi:hypothetical protein
LKDYNGCYAALPTQSGGLDQLERRRNIAVDLVLYDR